MMETIVRIFRDLVTGKTVVLTSSGELKTVNLASYGSVEVRKLIGKELIQ